MFLILAWIALTRCLFLARWAVANALAYLSVCLICSLSPFEAVALSFKPKSIPTLPVPHDCLGYSLTVIQAYQRLRLSWTNSQVLI